MREILVTGTGGFIGREFTRRLSDWQIERGDREGHVKGHPEIIVDFASYGNYHNQKDIREIYQANVTRLLELLHNTNPLEYKAFIVTGSSSEYGKSSIPMHELLRPQPDTFYASAKVAATALASVWAKEFNKPIVAVRPFSVTGPGEQERHLIPTLIDHAFSGEEMPFVPEPVHDFIDIRDFIEGIWHIIRRADRLKGEVLNLGSGKQYSNEQVKQLVERITGKKIKVKLSEQARSYDKSLWVADITRMKQLGWLPVYDLEESITDMVRAYGKPRKTD